MLSKCPWPPDRGPSSCFLYFRCTQCSPVGGSEGPLPRRKRKANTSSSSPSFVAPPLSLGLQLADQWQQIVECRCKAHRRRCKTRRRCIPKFRRVASGRRSCREKRWCFVKAFVASHASRCRSKTPQQYAQLASCLPSTPPSNSLCMACSPV